MVSQRHRPQGNERAAAFALGSGVLRPPVGWPDGEDDVLCSFIAAAPEPIRKRLGAHLAAAAIQEQK